MRFCVAPKVLYAINALRSCSLQQGGYMNKNPRGFSLIELLIVVAVILVIAAIAIPNLMRSRAAANQASAVGSLHVMNTAEATYSSTYGGYTPTLGYLGPPSTGTSPVPSGALLIDSILSGGSPGANRKRQRVVTPSPILRVSPIERVGFTHTRLPVALLPQGRLGTTTTTLTRLA